jgi:hypothetical protein
VVFFKPAFACSSPACKNTIISYEMIGLMNISRIINSNVSLVPLLKMVVTIFHLINYLDYSENRTKKTHLINSISIYN